jgi:multiple sugar transport system substrate-binding protein
MKRIFSIVLITCLMAVFVIGCTKSNPAATDSSSIPGGTASSETPNSSNKSEEKGKLTVWMLKQFVEEQNNEFLNRAKKFGEENNADVNVEIIATPDFLPKYTAAIESGKTPDVSFFGSSNVVQFASQGLLLDVSDLLQRIEQKNGPMFDTMKKVATVGGKSYGIPLWAESTVLYYRKDILKAAGFDNPPATWDEFRTIAKAVTDPQKGVYGAGLGFSKANSDAENQMEPLIWSFGGSYTDKDSKTVIFNSPGTIQAAKFISDIFLIDKSAPPAAVGWDDVGNNKSYLSGQAAMIINGGSVLNAAKKDNPDLYNNTGIAPMPAGPKGRFIPGISNNLGIFKNTKNKDLAEKFIEYMLNYDWYTKWVELAAPLDVPVYPTMGALPVWNQEKFKGFFDSAKDQTFLGYPGDFTAKAAEIRNYYFLNDMFQKILVDKVTPEKAVADLNAKVEAIYMK